jgi:plastocyanin
VIGDWGKCKGDGGGGKVHVVDQIGLDFIPRKIDVRRGDMIRWIWGGGSHTVTSGTLPCNDDGLFDSDLDDDQPVFEWTVPSHAPDLIDYFCDPHCDIDMNGSIIVTGEGGGGSDCEADLNDDGTVGVADLLIVLDAWGACE